MDFKESLFLIRNKKMFNVDNLTEDEYSVIKEWTKDGYRDIRDSYFKGESHKSLESIFRKYKENYNGILFRGIGLSVVNDDSIEYIKYLSSIKEGDIYTDIAPSSWSKNQEVAEHFLLYGNVSVLLVIIDAKNTGYDISLVSSIKKEDEVLIKPNDTFKVVEINTTSEKGVMYNKEVLYIRKVIIMEKLNEQ